MANLKKLTKQQMFDRAVVGVLKQGALSRTPGGACRYRTHRSGRTLACGVGHLIPDDLYISRIEGCVAEAATLSAPSDHDPDRSELLALALAFSGVDICDDDTVRFIDDIQSLHDGSNDIAAFVANARRFAKERGLAIPRLLAAS